MKRKAIFLAITLALCLAGATAQTRRSVPATPHPIDYIQPNGDTLTYRLHGDERRHYETTTDGYLIAKNKKGWFCYAVYDRMGTIKPTCRKAHNEEKRTACEQRYISHHIPNKKAPQQ